VLHFKSLQSTHGLLMEFSSQVPQPPIKPSKLKIAIIFCALLLKFLMKIYVRLLQYCYYYVFFFILQMILL